MTRSDGPRGVPATVWLLVAARAVNRLGAFTLPFLAVILTTEFSISVSAVGVIMAVFGIATIPSRLAGGWLTGRLGARATMVLGLVGCAAAQLGIAAAPSVPAVVVAVVVLGLSFEVYEPPSQAVIADVVAPNQRTAAYGLLGAALAGAGMLAGLLAAVLTTLDLRWLFVTDAATCLLCALVVRLVLPTQPRPSGAADSACSSPWRDRRLVQMFAVGTGFAVVYLQGTIALPLTILDRALPPSTLGLLLSTSAATMVLGQPLLRTRLVRDAPAASVLVSGYAVLGVGLAAYGFSTSAPGFVLATVVAALGDLLLLGRSLAYVADLAPDSARARYLAVYGLSWGLAAVIAPLAGAALMTGLGPAWTWTLLGCGCLALAAVQPRVTGSSKQGAMPTLAG